MIKFILPFLLLPATLTQNHSASAVAHNSSDIEIAGSHARRPLLNSAIVRNCAEVLVYFPQAPSGIYTIHPIPGTPIYVVCDMDYDGGGWTVIQRRGEPVPDGGSAQDFEFGWKQYEKGFGSADQDYWIGLTNIAAMTRFEDPELMFDLVDWVDEYRFAKYNVFQVSDSSEDYRLKTGGYTGNAGDAFLYQNNNTFSTHDNDKSEGKCTNRYPGGWWYYRCHRNNLKGRHSSKGSNGYIVDTTGITWVPWKGYYYSLKKVQMKIRSKSFKPLI